MLQLCRGAVRKPILTAGINGPWMNAGVGGNNGARRVGFTWPEHLWPAPGAAARWWCSPTRSAERGRLHSQTRGLKKIEEKKLQQRDHAGESVQNHNSWNWSGTTKGDQCLHSSEGKNTICLLVLRNLRLKTSRCTSLWVLSWSFQHYAKYSVLSLFITLTSPWGVL